MKALITAIGLALLPVFALAATECRLTEYPDHFEAQCVGDEISVAQAVPTGRAVRVPEPASDQTSRMVKATVSSRPTVPDRSAAAKTPLVIGKHRAPSAVREAAKASRMRLIQEQQRNNDIHT